MKKNNESHPFSMETDIRDKENIRHEDVAALNFIRNSSRFVFRKHRLNGLRSHIMQVLLSEDVERESRGTLVDGLLRYPVARPLRMLRIFRRRFGRPEEILGEIERFRIVEKYLTSRFVAVSEEFIVDYRCGGIRDVLLCGLQEYVEGEQLDPWTSSNTTALRDMAEAVASIGANGNSKPVDSLGRKIEKSAGEFVRRVKRMILEAQYVPDLAGVGNILVSASGQVKLVDINNITAARAGECPPVDDFGYPVCDKSIEALSMIERKFLGRKIDPGDPVYEKFLDLERLREVERLHRNFRASRRADN